MRTTETLLTPVVVMAMIAPGVLLIRLADRRLAVASPPSTTAASG
ncbi:hypothetical protein [Streptomyces sp. NPDC001500]